MAAEKGIQEPAVFEELSVDLIEERLILWDPDLFTLSGNNLHQYCTILSLLEFQNSKPEMFLITEDGVETPLSLVKMVEEFEIGPYSFQGEDEAMPTMQADPLQQGSPVPEEELQPYSMHKSEGGVLQETPLDCLAASEPWQRTQLQAREDESHMFTGGNLSMPSEPLQAYSAEKGRMQDLNTVISQQEVSQQLIVRCFTVGQPNEWSPSQGFEESNAQDVAAIDLFLESSSRSEDYDPSVGEASAFQISRAGERSHPCNNNEQLPFLVQPGAPCSITHQLPPSGEDSYKCPNSGLCSPTSATRHQITPMAQWERLFNKLSLSSLPDQMAKAVKKSFKCPECGKGFSRRSSIPRHLRLHGTKHLPPNAGQERSFSPSRNHLPHQKAHLGDKPIQCSDGGMCLGKGTVPKLDKPSDQPATLSDICGQRFAQASELRKPLRDPSKEKAFHCSDCGKGFTVNSSLMRHKMLHWPEKPFKCLFCDKSYIQKGHLHRHYQKNHTIC